MDSDGNLDLILDAADGISLQGLNRGGAEHGARPAIERSAMQGTDESNAAQPPLAQARVRVRADVVERMPALPGMTHDDVVPADHHGARLTFRNIRGGRRPLKIGLAHGSPDHAEVPIVAVHRAVRQLCNVAVVLQATL